MSFDLFGRLHKELSITGNALYEIVFAIAERVNRKTQVMRLHWHAASHLQRLDELMSALGGQLADQVTRRFVIQSDPGATLTDLDATISHTLMQVQGVKQSLMRVDAQIRDLKLEALHEDSLRFQQDLSLRSARMERLLIDRHAAAVGQSIRAMPQSSSVHIASVLRGPFLLAPSDGLIFRPDDIVVLLGLESELDPVVTWFTSQRPVQTQKTKSA
jgi:hypothetical protein